MADQQTRLANMRLDEVFLGIWQSMLGLLLEHWNVNGSVSVPTSGT